MKIAFDHQIFSIQPYGGVSRYFTSLAKELVSQHHVKIFAGIHRNQYLSDAPKELISGLKINKIPGRCSLPFSLLNQAISGMGISTWRPDIIHETYYGSRASGPRNIPRVITVYDMIHELFPEHFDKNDQTTKIKRTAIARADKIICISNSTKNDLIHILNIPEKKISVVHLGHTLTHLSSPITTAQTRPYLLYVGNRSSYKNFARFIRAFSMSKVLKADFDIVAFGGGSFNKEEANLITEAGLNPERIRQISGNDSELSTAYSCARAFIYPSIYEGFGLPPIEAMAHLCPVISSNTSSMPEVIGDAGLYFSPFDEEEMREVMEKSLYDDILLGELIEKGTQRAKLFSWSHCASKTIEVYKTVGR